jgi:hypothetical protein
MVLSRLVGRMGFAGEYDLDWSIGGVQNSSQAFGVVKDELWPLVCGESSCESDGQGTGIQERSGRHDSWCGDTLDSPALSSSFPDERE